MLILGMKFTVEVCSNLNSLFVNINLRQKYIDQLNKTMLILIEAMAQERLIRLLVIGVMAEHGTMERESA